MADPKTARAVNGNSPVEKTLGEKGKLFNGGSTPDKQAKASALRQLLALAKEVARDAEALAEYENSVEKQNAVEKELEQKKGEAQKLRDFNDKLIREFAEYKTQSASRADSMLTEFEQRFKLYDSNKSAVETMRAEVTEVKVRLEAAKVDAKSKQAEVERLGREVKKAEEEAKAHDKEMKELTAECEMQKSRVEAGMTELTACKTRLAEARAGLGDDVLKEYDSDGLRKLGLELKALSKKVHMFTLEYFNDPEGAKDSASEIQELKARFPRIPLSTASTKAAAQLRCAAAEAILADILTTHIFIPFYLAPEAKLAATSLLDIFGDDEARRAVYRCQILRTRGGSSSSSSSNNNNRAGAADEANARVEEDIVRKASGEARTTLHPLMTTDKRVGFYDAVPALFRDALGLWSRVQRARDLITAEKPDLNEVQPPGKYDEYDQPIVLPARSPKGSPTVANAGSKPRDTSIAAVLFPQVATREDIIFNGMALWKHQTETPAVVAAAAQPAQQQKSTPPISAHNGSGNGEGGRHQRRRSVIAGEMPIKVKLPPNAINGQSSANTNGHGGASVTANGA